MNAILTPLWSSKYKKIQLFDKYRGETMKRFARPCCETVENEEVDVYLEKKVNLKMAYARRDVS